MNTPRTERHRARITERQRARIKDIAERAGVSTATVDRVLNGRAGVAASTVARVKEAERALSGPGHGHNRGHNGRAGRRIGVALPADAGPSTDYLALSIQNAADAAGFHVEQQRYTKLDPAALAGALARLAGTGCDALVFQALEHPFVRDAVARIAARDVPLLTVMSDLQGSGAFGFVGPDNRAAGRTAGLLMGRFAHGSGRVAVLWGGTLYRSHEEREIGFRTVLRESYPHLHAVDLTAGGDESSGNYTEVSAVLKRYADLRGIYSVGGGNRGLVNALEDAGRAHDLVVIAHNLTPNTQGALVNGALDAVVHVDMDIAAARVVDAVAARLAGRTPAIERLSVGVIVKENAPTLPAAYDALDSAEHPPHTRPEEPRAA